MPRPIIDPDFLTPEQETRVLAFVKAVAKRHPELEEALTAAALAHPGLAYALADRGSAIDNFNETTFTQSIVLGRSSYHDDDLIDDIDLSDMGD